jgi:hypothetical protein
MSLSNNWKESKWPSEGLTLPRVEMNPHRKHSELAQAKEVCEINRTTSNSRIKIKKTTGRSLK